MKVTTELDIASGSSQIFLRAWQTWRIDPQRPRMLHVVAVCPGNFSNQPDDAELKPLARQLDAQLWGLLPGFHRLTFENGHVLLTLCRGQVAKVLRQQQFEADAIYLNSDTLGGADWLYLAKGIARLCKTGTQLTTSSSFKPLQAALKQCGFVAASGCDERQATYNPAWLTAKRPQPAKPATCVVVGAGLAGAAVANSLARRGWTVTVLDAASKPASGASSLPAGLLVPHTSPDDSQLSRLSRSGVRMTLEQAGRLLQSGTDWHRSGVLERSVDGTPKKLPSAWAEEGPNAAADWSRPATPEQLQAAGLPPASSALWHASAAWVKPEALVKAWLAAPGIEWGGNAPVVQLKPSADGWLLLGTTGQVLAEAHLVVLATAYASQALAATVSTAPMALQPIRGQISWGLHIGNGGDGLKMPAFPVNGQGGLIPAIPGPNGPFWLMGSSYERDASQAHIYQQDNDDNFQRLRSLLPQAAAQLGDQFKAPHCHAWAGIRCATPNRLPLLGRLVNTLPNAPVWLCTGMGSRGLTFAALCAELLAAQLHGEPLPVDRQLADALMGTRF